MSTTLELPKAAQKILAMPGVQSLEKEPDGWCCHLHYGWTTDALGGGGTIIDTSLATIADHVKGAYPAPDSQQAPQGPAGRTIGYARVSTKAQSVEAQVAQLKAEGAQLVFSERVSTRKAESQRPQLMACLLELQAGDELLITKLDRLGRTQREVIERLATLQERQVHVRTLDGLVNTKALGKMAPLVVGLLTGLAEVERELIRERTLESIEHRRATGGDLGGRPLAYTPEQADQVRRLAIEGMSVAATARATGLSESTCRRLRKGSAATTS